MKTETFLTKPTRLSTTNTVSITFTRHNKAMTIFCPKGYLDNTLEVQMKHYDKAMVYPTFNRGRNHLGVDTEAVPTIYVKHPVTKKVIKLLDLEGETK